MGKKRTRKELQNLEAFEKLLQEKVSISAEFDLPLTALALVVEGGWQEEDVRRALVALPNTRHADAQVSKRDCVGRSQRLQSESLPTGGATGRGPARAR